MFLVCAALISPLYPLLMRAVVQLHTYEPKIADVVQAKYLLQFSRIHAADFLIYKHGLKGAVELIRKEE